jgi:histidine triad (HIT) family protein
MPYDDNNIFAKILRGEIPAYTVYEDDATLAFMDVMPQSAGHTLVIPRERAQNLFDLSPAAAGAVFNTVQHVARAVMQAFAADGIMLNQFNGPAAGQTVFHFHVHIVPRYEDVPLRRHSGTMEDAAILAEHAQRVRAALAS